MQAYRLGSLLENMNIEVHALWYMRVWYTRNSVYKGFFQNIQYSEPLFFHQNPVLETLRKPLVILTFFSE